MPTPAELGYYMPAEWHPHARCWMAWPCRVEHWGGEAEIEAARRTYAEVAQAIARFESVTMICNPSDAADASLLCGAGIEVLTLSLNDSWFRDYGPSFVINGQGGVAGVHWRFNAWGGNHPDYEKDAVVGATLLDHLGLPRFEAPLIMEGGAFHVDGEGTLLTTEQCLLNPNRNPSMSREEVERHLRDYLGIQKVIWLGQGYEEDETNGHIDEIACFIRPGVVLTLTTDDTNDANYAVFQDNLDRLKQARDAQGRSLEIITVPQPTRQDHKGVRLTLSYTNFYLANGGLILPTFNDPADTQALRTFQRLYPDREIVPVEALNICRGGGSIHCITQQMPVG